VSDRIINNLRIYTALTSTEELLAKALGASEMSQMAAIEKRLYEYYVKSWDALVDKAAKDTNKLASKGKYSQIPKTVDRIMSAWAGAVIGVSIQSLKKTYELGKAAAAKRARSKKTKPIRYPAPSNVPISKASDAFELYDESVVAALNEQQIYWIGKFYEDGVSESIVEVVRQHVIQEGISPKKAGDIMEEKIRSTMSHVELPSGWRGTPRQYMEGLTANAMTNSRVQGQIRSFAEIGVTKYTISNPSDKRTCERCAHLEGKTFSLKQGVDQMNADLNAKTPEDVRKTHPWLSKGKLVKISPTPGKLSGKAAEKDSKALSEAGLSLPPYHFKCRCTVDVDVESADYDDLEPMELGLGDNGTFSIV
jgi:hypothetical protein